MASILRAALLHTDRAGTKEAMIDKHQEGAPDAAEGAQVMWFQELCDRPYFCRIQDAAHDDDTEQIPDGPRTQRFQSVAQELGMVLVLPNDETLQARECYDTAMVMDADCTYVGKLRKQHHQVKGCWETFYFRTVHGGYPVFDTAAGKVGVDTCYDRRLAQGCASSRARRPDASGELVEA